MCLEGVRATSDRLAAEIRMLLCERIVSGVRRGSSEEEGSRSSEECQVEVGGVDDTQPSQLISRGSERHYCRAGPQHPGQL